MKPPGTSIKPENVVPYAGVYEGASPLLLDNSTDARLSSNAQDYSDCAFNHGELFRDRYRVIGKLGYGSAFTVWLCRDQHNDDTYVALKVCTNASKVHREIPIYEHINSLHSKHGGRQLIRALLDSFEIVGPYGNHKCLVHEALGMNLEEFRELVPNEIFEPVLVRHTLRDILRALNFLHKEAGIIHTDIQPKNILLGVADTSAFRRFEKDEREQPMPRKELPSRTIYCSRLMPVTHDIPSLCDFSEARFDSDDNTDLVMPDVYRAPEVVLSLRWSYGIDHWALAMTLRDLMHSHPLFRPKGPDGRYSEEHHLAQMVAIMGPPSPDFLKRSIKSEHYWDAEGNWIGSVAIPNISLESVEQRLNGEEKRLFLNYMRKFLQWVPEDRSHPEEMFMDEWLLADLIESGQVMREAE
ncbi:hypothetical protein LTR62_001855 [Meristemomyces frigidus]|uniref:Protein kinase domain-containing protein n=1 Tax=Meristemomyces frigidus TaxID=1508187 RepID=A0AAN7YM80_9PEZI|nr:hypothetical protein LTR62_001855 [Meristemomyces frigidus]